METSGRLHCYAFQEVLQRAWWGVREVRADMTHVLSRWQCLRCSAFP